MSSPGLHNVAHPRLHNYTPTMLEGVIPFIRPLNIKQIVNLREQNSSSLGWVSMETGENV